MNLLDHLGTCARANRLANHRLHAAMAPLSAADLAAPRVGFFPSLAATLHHILAVDVFYIAALRGEADMAAQYRAVGPCTNVAAHAAAQRVADERLIRFVGGPDAPQLDAEIAMDRETTTQVDRIGHVLAHLFTHQTHHRGQVHAMLASTAIAPPQLDEFLMPTDAPLREADMRTLGWSERDLFGG